MSRLTDQLALDTAKIRARRTNPIITLQGQEIKRRNLDGMGRIFWTIFGWAIVIGFGALAVSFAETIIPTVGGLGL